MGRRFSHDELVEILQKAVAAQGKEPDRSYAAEDLVAAARELGIDPARVRAAAEEHLARRDRPLARRPFDSRIRLQTDPGGLELRIPPLRPKPANLAPLGGGAVWLTFIGFWTWGAVTHGSLPFAIFSAPFWAVGLTFLARSALALVRSTTLEIRGDRARLSIAPLGRSRELRRDELRVRRGEVTSNFQIQGKGQPPTPTPAVLLEHGTETITLLEGYSDQEQRWIADELAAWIPRAEG